MLQALYSCGPFRERVAAHRAPWLAEGEKESGDDETLLTCLRDLFNQMTFHKKRVGTIGPKKFVAKLKEENIMFRGYQQQDAHEFLNYTVNEIADLLRKDEARAKQLREEGKLPPLAEAPPAPPTSPPGTPRSTDGGGARGVDNTDKEAEAGEEGEEEDGGKQKRTWVHDVFGGVLTNETRCLNCECTTSRDEEFLDLSVELTQNSSITHCLRCFSASETLNGDDKFHCDMCGSLQEAQKCMRLKCLPRVLALHLKRFKFVEQVGRFRKVSYRVSFPKELRMPNTSENAVDAERLYRLRAIVVHAGSGPNQGHYLTIVHSHEMWLLFDDEKVNTIDEEMIATCFGVSHDALTNTETGYLLFYETVDEEEERRASMGERVGTPATGSQSKYKV